MDLFGRCRDISIWLKFFSGVYIMHKINEVFGPISKIFLDISISWFFIFSSPSLTPTPLYIFHTFPLSRESHAEYAHRVFPPFIQTSLCRVYPDRQYIQTNLEWKCCCEVGSPSWDTGLLLPVNWCWKKTFSIVLLLLTASLVFDRLWILLIDNLNIKFHFAMLK